MSTAEAAFNEMTKVKPWTSVDFQRFWARANELGWKKDEVHAHFGLESMKDFSGTLDDALAMLESPVPEAEPVEDFPPEDETYHPKAIAPNAIEPVRTWTEAPASVTIRAYAPNGFDVMLTIRDDDTAALIERMTGALGWLANKGYKPKYGNGGGGSNGRAQAMPQAQAQSGEAPMCPTHNRPMKVSQHGGWYCTAKVADDDGTGKAVYCKQVVKDD